MMNYFMFGIELSAKMSFHYEDMFKFIFSSGNSYHPIPLSNVRYSLVPSPMFFSKLFVCAVVTETRAVFNCFRHEASIAAPETFAFIKNSLKWIQFSGRMAFSSMQVMSNKRPFARTHFNEIFRPFAPFHVEYCRTRET